MELVGRSAERKRLATGLAAPDIGLIIVRGPSGAGKTALVDAVLADLSQSRILGRGKYAEGDATSGFAPILQALSQAASNALDLLYDPAAGAESLRKTLAGQLSLLEGAGFTQIDVLVTPEQVILPPLDSGESRARIVDAVARLIRWLSGFGVPVVLFIDDWQRAPPEAHSLTSIATRDHTLQHCSFIFATRGDEREATHDSNARAEIIEIGPLEPDQQIALLGSAVGSTAAGLAISSWLGQSTSGLPLDLLETARALIASSAISSANGTWLFDSVAAAAVDRSDFADAVVRRSRELPPNHLVIGAAFALWGDRADIRQVCQAFEAVRAEVDDALQGLQREGILRIVGKEVSFVHDRMRAALLDVIDPGTRRAILVDAADRLLRLYRSHQHPSMLRRALQFRLAAGLDDALPVTWCEPFSEEALRARNTANASAAEAFAEAAWTLRSRQALTDKRLDAVILREATLAAAARHDVAVLRHRISEMISLADTDESIGLAYETAIIAATRAGERELAWSSARQGLERLGARLPVKARKIDLHLAILRWRLVLILPRGKPPLGHTASTVDPLSRIVHFASVTAYSREPLMALLMGLRATARARRLGYHSAYWRGRNLLHFGALGDFARASREAKILEPEVATSPFARAATLYRVLYFGLIWTQPLATLREGYIRIYDMAITEGDLVFAALAVRNALLIAWRTQPTLAGVAAAVEEAEDKAMQLRDAAALKGISVFANTVRALQDPRGFEAVDGIAPWASPHASPGSEAPIVWIEILGIRGDWSGIMALAEQYKSGLISLNSHPGGVVWRFHENLARLKLGFRLRRRDLRYVRRAARLNPTDHLAKLRILEAESLRRKGSVQACLDAYSAAVEVSAAGSSRLEAGMAAECAAAAARGFGKAELAAKFESRARDTWNAWGALAKTHDIASPAANSIAEKRLAEAELRVAAANRSERAKSRFLAEVGHELRTPLQGMQSLLDLAAESPAEVSMNELREVFGSLKAVVDDLTDLAALGGGAPLNLKSTDIAKLVKSESQIATALAQRKAVAFTMELQHPSLLVRIDHARVRQVVRNLLSNAVKYSDRGEINIRLACTPAQPSGTIGISIAVEDRGPGFSDNQLLQLFEPFERGDRDDADGLGLGLALSRRIAERMGGTLTAENRAPRGARFVFRFEADQADPEPAPEATTFPLDILLVEDVPLNRRMIATLLRRAGHRVSEAEDGATALTLQATNLFDLVLLDIGLPDIDGFQVLEAIKRSTSGSAPRVIILTATAAPEITERAQSLGAALMLRKPVSSDELRAAIQSVSSLPPQDDPQILAAFEAELRDLESQAHSEILARGRALLILRGPAADVHRLAGLAAQFGAPEVAAAADLLETELIAGNAPSGLRMLETALIRFSEGLDGVK